MDLALSKIERAAERDRTDVIAMAHAGQIDADVFSARYLEEVRPYLLNREHVHDRTVEAWAALVREITSARGTTSE